MFPSQRDILKMINIGEPLRNAKKKAKGKMNSSVLSAAFELLVENTSWKQLLPNKAKIL